MTREEAIHLLQEDKALYETDICHASDGSPDGDLLEALDMAIEALQTPPISQRSMYQAGYRQAQEDRPRGEWTTDEVAELLANTFGDECACNWNGNDEWLPEVCKYAETTCPSPKEANGCWKQFLIQGGAGWVRR